MGGETRKRGGLLAKALWFHTQRFPPGGDVVWFENGESCPTYYICRRTSKCRLGRPRATPCQTKPDCCGRAFEGSRAGVPIGQSRRIRSRFDPEIPATLRFASTARGVRCDLPPDNTSRCKLC